MDGRVMSHESSCRGRRLGAFGWSGSVPVPALSQDGGETKCMCADLECRTLVLQLLTRDLEVVWQMEERNSRMAGIEKSLPLVVVVLAPLEVELLLLSVLEA